MTDRKKMLSIWLGSMIYMIASWFFFATRSDIQSSEEVLRTVLLITFIPPVIAYSTWPLKFKHAAVRALVRAVIFLIQLPLTIALAFLVGQVILKSR